MGEEETHVIFINCVHPIFPFEAFSPLKILQEIGIPDHLICLLQNLYAGQKTTEPDMKQWTGSKLGKMYIKAVCCHFAYLTYMQRASCEMLDWIKHKLESSFPGEISINHPYGRKRRTKEPFDNGERGE